MTNLKKATLALALMACSVMQAQQPIPYVAPQS